MTDAFAHLLQAPFVRRRVLNRVRALVERYDALLAAPAVERRLPVPVLFKFPSALRERDAVGPRVLRQRRELAEAELRALKAAAPLPAPSDRPDRLRIQGLAEAQWLARELRGLRRAMRSRPAPVALDLYFETNVSDPLPDPERIAPSLHGIPRGSLVNLAFRLASLRYGVSDLDRWLVTPPPVIGPGPVSAGPAEALAEGQGRRITVRDRPVAVFRSRGALYAVGAVCPHRGGPLDQGEIEGGAVLCPLHGWAFDLETGQLRDQPTVDIPTYRVEVVDGQILVYPPDEGPG